MALTVLYAALTVLYSQGAARASLAGAGFGAVLSSEKQGRNGAAPRDPNAGLYL